MNLRNLILTALFSTVCIHAQVQVIPQVADGGGWRSIVVLTNTTTSATVASLTFNMEVLGSGGTTVPWTPTFLENISTSAINLPAGSSVFLHTPGTAATVSQGWAQLTAGSGVQGYVIYTYTAPGSPKQDATAPAIATASRILVPFDNTTGLVTTMAVVNPNPIPLSISANFKTSAGAVTTGSLPNIPAGGHEAFVMPTQFAGTAGQSGLAEFYSNTGSFSIIALRAHSPGPLSFTAAPVFLESGAPIITTSSSGGGGGIPAGDITFGGFSIGKTTTSSGVAEGVGGLFAAYTPTAWNLPFNGTKIDKCLVYDISYSGANYPSAPSLSLDAGKITLTGPGLPGGSLIVPEINTAGSLGPVYTAMLSSLVDGGTYTLTGAGGTQVEGFVVSTTLPDNFTTNANTINLIDRTKPLPINWTGTGFDNVIISVNGTTLSATDIHSVVLTCIVAASLHSYSIPTAALSKLPAVAGPLSGGIGSLSVTTAPAFTGNVSSQGATGTTLTPKLVGGGKITYGGFSPYFSVQQSVTIQ